MGKTLKSSTSNRRRFLKATGASVAALTLAGCASDDAGNGGGSGGDSGGDSGGSGGETGTATGTPEQSVDEVVIGSNHPLSGSLAATGVGMSNAIKLAAMRKNEEGGIESLDGAEVTVIEGDNQGAQELGGQVSEELLSEGADVLTGCYSSPVTTAATQVAERQGVPFVISIAAADNILQGRDFNYVYRPQPPARRLASDYADLVPSVIRDGGGTIDTAGLFYINNSYGQAIRDSLREFLPEQNVEIVEETAIEFGASNANTQVSRLRSADPDTIIATTYVAGGVLLAQALQDQDYRPPYLTASASATFTDDDAVSDIGEFANGVLDNNYALNPTVDKTAEVRSQFRDNYDQEFSASVGMAYTAAEVIIQAVEEAGSVDPDDINEALMGLSYEDHISAMGAIEFDDQGENVNALGPVNQVQDLSVRVVYPEEYAEAEPQV
ncbi:MULTISPECIES: ABC transporter substrate-binding protein [Haloferax]|uniref:ABC transporter substrate-binding protein n=1 Tax=Haloferax sp. Atlit-48N TaxID=2077198 RepID=A0ACD5I155_9EURY|nr:MULTISPECIES: ABC transporter substrate-binding protein [Haloferax]MBC9987668.1 twin-arginine translocation signal domain-containing protein [Haloferax sp. AS1]RDZ30584.1 ABC transporter substrate-binding protein [Haloferax sp. Atlit-48N]RDZ33624.1 ABC transporter substrate-binding protein [Haloferax sp. Atlit-24N]RDZ36052.1 ABC transporter substrate-binding protein [Haloferax sp. Atlit-47N]RLM34148.1 ABC transporter substrate-binding protein [Haloferax sp. Atlit-109R]